MNMLANLKTNDTIKNETDSIGGGRTLDSGLMDFKIALAYLKKSDSGALSVNFVFNGPNKEELKQTFWVTGGDAKGNKNTYKDKNGDDQYLPGFLIANSVALLSIGKELSEMETEEKTINLYNATAKAEVPTKVPCLTDLHGQEITAGIIKQIVDKTKKDDAGVYQPTGETREENEVDKFFRTKDHMTTAEIRAQAETPVFYETWKAKWTGVTRDKSTKTGGTAGAPKAGAPAAGKPKSSLFGA